MQGRIVKKGFCVIGRMAKSYRPCTLVAGPYDFQNAVRLRIGAHELICHADQFVETKPPSAYKVALKKRLDDRSRWRGELANRVMDVLKEAGGELSLVTLADRSKIWPAVSLWQRLAHWQELKPVHWTKDGKFKYP